VIRILGLTHTNPLDDNRVLKTQELGVEIGATYYVIGVSRGLRKQAKKNFILVGSFLKKITRGLSSNPSVPRSIRLTISGFTYAELYLGFFFRSIFLRPHLIHVHDWYLLPLAVILRRLFRSSILYDAHELESEVNGITSEMRKLVKLVERSLWKHIDFFVTVSPSIQEWYLSEFGDKPSEVVLNSPRYATHQTRKVDSNYFRKTFDLSQDTKIFLYMGALEEGRGIRNTVEAFRMLEENAALIFMGQGSLSNEIIQWRSGDALSIFLHPPVDHGNIVEIASTADFGLCLIEDVSLSDYYCLPNKFFDYAFSRLPILCSDLPDMSNLVQLYNLGFVVENRVDSIFDLMKNLANNHIRLLPCSDKELLAMSWNHQSTKLISAYRSLLHVEAR
jgi:glycosyltransferase involved in cell wall biosynthesis